MEDYYIFLFSRYIHLFAVCEIFRDDESGEYSYFASRYFLFSSISMTCMQYLTDLAVIDVCQFILHAFPRNSDENLQLFSTSGRIAWYLFKREFYKGSLKRIIKSFTRSFGERMKRNRISEFLCHSFFVIMLWRAIAFSFFLFAEQKKII